MGDEALLRALLAERYPDDRRLAREREAPSFTDSWYPGMGDEDTPGATQARRLILDRHGRTYETAR